MVLINKDVVDAMQEQERVRMAGFGASKTGRSVVTGSGIHSPGSGEPVPSIEIAAIKERARHEAAIAMLQEMGNAANGMLLLWLHAESRWRQDAYADTLAAIRDADNEDGEGTQAGLMAHVTLDQRGFLPYGRMMTAEAENAELRALNEQLDEQLETSAVALNAAARSRDELENQLKIAKLRADFLQGHLAAIACDPEAIEAEGMARDYVRQATVALKALNVSGNYPINPPESLVFTQIGVIRTLGEQLGVDGMSLVVGEDMVKTDD